jgi:hypothetical protein
MCDFLYKKYLYSTTKYNFDPFGLVAKDISASKASKSASQSVHGLSTA